jgi:eukaryotic-like serine/threonine-protein kinase
VYLSVEQEGVFHIWRERFPDGEPEQVTSGPTEEEGIAMAADGKSFITSVGTMGSSIWIHDKKGDRQFSSEGNTWGPSFSSDGNRLYYVKWAGKSPKEELWRTDLKSGDSERLLPGYGVDTAAGRPDYSISKDENRVAFGSRDENGVTNIWIGPTDKRAGPQKLASAENEDTPMFLPNGDIVYRRSHGGKNYLYRRNPESGEEKQVIADPILDLLSVSEDGKWVAVVVSHPEDAEHPNRAIAYPIEGGPGVILCKTFCGLKWDKSGKHLFTTLYDQGDQPTYFLPVDKNGLPKVKAEGLVSQDELKGMDKIEKVKEIVESAMTPEVYAYSRKTVRRNLYRVPLE